MNDENQILIEDFKKDFPYPGIILRKNDEEK